MSTFELISRPLAELDPCPTRRDKNSPSRSVTHICGSAGHPAAILTELNLQRDVFMKNHKSQHPLNPTVPGHLA